jgi:hypothetical protein
MKIVPSKSGGEGLESASFLWRGHVGSGEECVPEKQMIFLFLVSLSTGSAVEVASSLAGMAAGGVMAIGMVEDVVGVFVVGILCPW